jgi:hypothetical protein
MAQTEGTTLDTDCDGVPEYTYSGGAWVPAITAQPPEGTCIDLADMEGDVDAHIVYRPDGIYVVFVDPNIPDVKVD